MSGSWGRVSSRSRASARTRSGKGTRSVTDIGKGKGTGSTTGFGKGKDTAKGEHGAVIDVADTLIDTDSSETDPY